MKRMFLHATAFAMALLLMVSCAEQEAPQVSESTDQKETSYDSVLAQKYGADDYGMKKFVMAFLKKGPNRDLDSAQAMELQMAHLENIGRMAEAGKLSLAGPFLDTGDIRGIYIFNVESIEEARALTETDPAIKAGSLVMELREWYGSAAVVGINEVHQKLGKRNVTE